MENIFNENDEKYNKKYIKYKIKYLNLLNELENTYGGNPFLAIKVLKTGMDLAKQGKKFKEKGKQLAKEGKKLAKGGINLAKKVPKVGSIVNKEGRKSLKTKLPSDKKGIPPQNVKGTLKAPTTSESSRSGKSDKSGKRGSKKHKYPNNNKKNNPNNEETNNDDAPVDKQSENNINRELAKLSDIKKTNILIEYIKERKKSVEE